MHLLLVNNSISRLAVYHPLKVNSKNILSCRLRLKFDSFESCRLPHWEALKWLYLRFKVTSSYCIGHPYFYPYFEKLHDLKKKKPVKVKKTHMTNFICRKSSERRIVSKIINRGRGCIPDTSIYRKKLGLMCFLLGSTCTMHPLSSSPQFSISQNSPLQKSPCKTIHRFIRWKKPNKNPTDFYNNNSLLLTLLPKKRSCT